jgi:hypothetical protein
MAHDRLRPRGHGGAQQHAIPRGIGKPDRKYAAVQAMEPAAGYATFDRAASDAEANQLQV